MHSRLQGAETSAIAAAAVATAALAKPAAAEPSAAVAAAALAAAALATTALAAALTALAALSPAALAHHHPPPLRRGGKIPEQRGGCPNALPHSTAPGWCCRNALLHSPPLRTPRFFFVAAGPGFSVWRF